ncbi:MAG: MBOAT family protein [Deltaproteobacteria bacterium]|nr:MBOAT family protein [Deltaproteobacteria bacterium]
MNLLSLEFVALAVALIFWVRFVRGPGRIAGFLAGSAYYASTFVSPLGAAVVLGFTLLGYAFALLARARARLTAACVAALVALFAYLRGYDLVLYALPEGAWSPLLAVAGLSYLLFKILHVVVDSAGGRLDGLTLPAYLAYCFNFTTFLLGPIQRFQDFAAQWNGERDPLSADLGAHVDAVNRVLRGYLKKWVLADFVARWALLPGEGIEGLGPFEVLSGAWIFYVYLYLDFSGYCDIVIGIGRLMGVAPPENFRFPFLSPNIAQYWLRVHRSLTEWLTDYVFHPLYTALLRMRRLRGHRLAARNLAIAGTMLVAGVWHGTTLSFVLFGGVHALIQVAYRTLESILESRLGAAGLRSLRARRWWSVVGTACTLLLTASAYVFFVLTPDDLASLWTRIGG